MPRTAAAIAAAFAVLVLAGDARAQDEAEDEAEAEAEARPSIEEMIEVAREAYRPPGLLRERCPEAAAGEIVVCAPLEQGGTRVPSSTDDAIAEGRPVYDGVPRAPSLAPPPCDPRSPGCFKFGQPPPMPLIIDLSKIPEALTPEEAARVFRADIPPEP